MRILIDSLTRRRFGAFAPFAVPWPLAGWPDQPESAPAEFPAQAADVVRETVAAAHGNFARLKALVDSRPALANAAIDWGFGDWEDALGAASHMGNRAIAEYLIAKGARPTLFSAAMMGELDAVKAFLAAWPAARAIAGPHGISLLAHAKAGGKAAESVARHLEATGGAGGPERMPLEPGEVEALGGHYRFGTGPSDSIEIAARNGQLTFARKGSTARGLVPLGSRTFHPVGARAVVVRFSGSGANAALTVEDGPVRVSARKAPR